MKETTKDLCDVTIGELMHECRNHRTSGIIGCIDCPFRDIPIRVCPDTFATMDYYNKHREHVKVTLRELEWADFEKKITNKRR